MLNNLAGIYGVGVPASTTSYESIASWTVGVSPDATIDFTSIPSTYKHLQLRGISRNTTASNALDLIKLQFNGITSSSYAFHALYGDGASAAALGSSSQTYGIVSRTSQPRAGTTSNSFGALVCDILDYTDTNKNTTVRSLSGVDLNGSGAVELNSSLFNNTAAITSIKLIPETGSFAQYSSFALYGIKG